MVDTILRTVLLVVCGLACVAYAIGYRVGARAQPGSKAGVGIAVAVFAVLALLVGGTYPLARQHGPVISDEALYLACALDAALLGGYATGRKRQKQSASGVGVYVLTTLVVVALIVARMAQMNAQLGDFAKQLGLDKTQPQTAPPADKDCAQSLQEIYKGFQHYAEVNDSLPPAADWMDQEDLRGGIQSDTWLHCPAVSNRRDNNYGYAYNESLAGRKLNGKKLSALPEAARTPLVYDSSDLAKNAHDAVTSLPNPGRHGGRDNILYCDGHVASVAPK